MRRLRSITGQRRNKADKSLIVISVNQIDTKDHFSEFLVQFPKHELAFLSYCFGKQQLVLGFLLF